MIFNLEKEMMKSYLNVLIKFQDYLHDDAIKHKTRKYALDMKD